VGIGPLRTPNSDCDLRNRSPSSRRCLLPPTAGWPGDHPAPAGAHFLVKGAFIPIGGVTSGFPSRLVWPARNLRTSSEDLATPGGIRDTHSSRTIALRTLHDAVMAPPIRHEPWGPVWPDNVHETGVSPQRTIRISVETAEAQVAERTRKDLVTGPIRVSVPFKP
jgi:hypothetical protein